MAEAEEKDTVYKLDKRLATHSFVHSFMDTSPITALYWARSSAVLLSHSLQSDSVSWAMMTARCSLVHTTRCDVVRPDAGWQIIIKRQTQVQILAPQDSGVGAVTSNFWAIHHSKGPLHLLDQ